MEDRIVAHLDMDAFYASIEERDNPALKGKPLVVGSDPRKNGGHGVVTTCNYAARIFGIRSAMPCWQALERCNFAIFVKPRIDVYRDESRKVMEVLRRYSKAVEIVGLDEAYLDLTQLCEGNWSNARRVAKSLQAAILRETGLGASIGIAQGRSTAKIASDEHKPYGITVVEPRGTVGFLANLRVGRIPGCGPKMQKKLAEQQIFQVADLLDRAQFLGEGKWVKHLLWIASGQDRRGPNLVRAPAKSHSQERTYARGVTDSGAQQEMLLKLLDRLVSQAKEFGVRTVSIKLRDKQFNTITRDRSFSVPVPVEIGADLLRDAVLKLYEENRPASAVRLIGVKLSGFTDEAYPALSSFSSDSEIIRYEDS